MEGTYRTSELVLRERSRNVSLKHITCVLTLKSKSVLCSTKTKECTQESHEPSQVILRI